MSLDVPESSLTSAELAVLANFRRELADALDAALSVGGSAGDAIDLVNGEATTVVAGSVVYVSASGTFKKAKADDITTGRAIGVLQADTATGATGAVQMTGSLELTTTQWDAVAGTTGGLAFNVPYYLSATTAGRITVTPPSTAGEVLQLVLVGVTPTLGVIRIAADAEEIGSGDNIIELENDNASAALICQPIYSSSADGFDLGRANGSSKSTLIGLVAEASIASGARGLVVTGGIIVATTDQWDVVAGTVGGLAAGTTYYLDPATAGRLTATAPTTPGQEVVQVIVAFSTTEARIAIQPAILL